MPAREQDFATQQERDDKAEALAAAWTGSEQATELRVTVDTIESSERERIKSSPTMRHLQEASLQHGQQGLLARMFGVGAFVNPAWWTLKVRLAASIMLDGVQSPPLMLLESSSSCPLRCNPHHPTPVTHVHTYLLLQTLLQYRTGQNYRSFDYLGPRMFDKVIFAVVVMSLYIGKGAAPRDGRWTPTPRPVEPCALGPECACPRRRANVRVWLCQTSAHSHASAPPTPPCLAAAQATTSRLLIFPIWRPSCTCAWRSQVSQRSRARTRNTPLGVHVRSWRPSRPGFLEIFPPYIACVPLCTASSLQLGVPWLSCPTLSLTGLSMSGVCSPPSPCIQEGRSPGGPQLLQSICREWGARAAAGRSQTHCFDLVVGSGAMACIGQ